MCFLVTKSMNDCDSSIPRNWIFPWKHQFGDRGLNIEYKVSLREYVKEVQ